MILAHTQILTPQHGQALVRSMAALVPGVVAGVLGDVVLAAPEGDLARRIGEEAGCKLALAATPGAAFSQGLAAMRGPWRWILLQGHAPLAGFFEEIDDFCAADQRAALIRREPHNWQTRLIVQQAAVCGLLWHSPEAPVATDFAALQRQFRQIPTLQSRMRLLA